MTEYGYIRVCAAVPQVRTPLTAITIIGLIILLTAMGCGGGSHDARLERIGDMLSDAPKKALRALDSIDPGALSEKDRAFYGFLSVKANDKAFIPPCS